VRFAWTLVEGWGEKRSCVRDEVARSSWVKRERRRDVALMRGLG
jgi:hypothetical protein